MPWVPRPLPGTGARVVPLREAVEEIAPGAFEALPLARRVLAEDLVRHGDPASTREHLAQVVLGRGDAGFPFFPARVVLQDLLGTPALVDLAGLRDAVAEAGGDPSAVNPVVPTQLVVDHSVDVEVDGSHRDALRRNMELERRRNAERFEFLAWARRAFRDVEVVMPGNGILHPIHLERLCPVVQVAGGVAFADTVVGTDRHTSMVNALGVLGFGVGGITAESVMLGRPIWMRLPPVVGVELRGARRPGVQALDLGLALAEFLRREGVAGCVLELRGDGAAALPLPDRATLSSLAPELGAIAALFAVDEQTLRFLRLTGRAGAQVHLVEAHARAQGLWAGALGAAAYGRRLPFDLGAVGRAVAGPAHPHERVPLEHLLDAGVARPAAARVHRAAEGALPDGPVVIAAITGCTSTSNPRDVIAAGLLARNAVARGLARSPWVKTSLAPGSRAVERYLEDAGLLAPLRALGFGVVGFGCTSCNGLSGPLAPAVERELDARGLAAAAVLSGARSFGARIHPRVRQAFLASPALVVAYAIAGTIRADVAGEPLATDRDGRPVTLAELWPSDGEVDAVLARHVRPEHFGHVYEELLSDDRPARRGVQVPARFPWSPASTVLRRPPYWDPALAAPPAGRAMRAVAMLGDDVSTEDLSPSGAILPGSAAGRHLAARGVALADLGSYGPRRGDHLVAVRATLAGPRVRNELVPEVEGSFTRLEPGGPVLPLHDGAELWLARGQELLVIAGRNYGCGSARDWAAKGVRLLGVRAVVAESFDGVHRANLVGVGVLPLELPPGTTRRTLGLDGFETFALEGLDAAPEPGGTLTLRISRRDGTVARTPVRCRIDTAEEREVFRAGGLLPRIAAELARRGAADDRARSLQPPGAVGSRHVPRS